MAKKESITVTADGLHLLTTLCHSGYFEGFYGKNVFLTDRFKGDRQYLFQALGNLGATPSRLLEDDADIIIIADVIMDGDNNFFIGFKNKIQPLLNLKNSPYRKMRFITEEHLLLRLDKRITDKNDSDIADLLKKYKNSAKDRNPDLFEKIDNEKETV